MRVEHYHLKRYSDGTRDIILTDGSQEEIINFPQGGELDFIATADQLRNEKPIYYRAGLLTTEPEPVGEGE